MKKIIEGRKYDTETARQVAEWSNRDYGNFGYTAETLYLKRTGEFFLHGEGGARSKYRECEGVNLFGSGEKIVPLSEQEARAWCEEHCDGDTYEEIFGEVAE
jgi:hypothetical protein